MNTHNYPVIKLVTLGRREYVSAMYSQRYDPVPLDKSNLLSLRLYRYSFDSKPCGFSITIYACVIELTLIMEVRYDLSKCFQTVFKFMDSSR